MARHFVLSLYISLSCYCFYCFVSLSYFTSSFLPLLQSSLSSPQSVSLTALPPILKTNSIAGLSFCGWEICYVAEASGKRNYLIIVLSAWHCQSHSVGPLMREALYDWLTRLKGSSQGGVGAQQLPNTAAYQAGWQSSCLQPHGEQGIRSFDRDTICRRRIQQDATVRRTPASVTLFCLIPSPSCFYKTDKGMVVRSGREHHIWITFICC